MADPTPIDYRRAFNDALDEVRREIRGLNSADGTQTYNAVDKVKQLITDFRAELDDYLATLNVYTKSETDDRISHPPASVSVTGNVTATGDLSASGNANAADVNASGRVTSTSAFRSAGSRAYICTSGYAGGWIDGDGTIGISPSSIRFKIDIEEWLPNIGRLLLLRAVLFRYDPAVLAGAKPDAPRQLGFIAEELEALGFPEFVFYDDGEWEWAPNPEDEHDGEYILVGPPRIQGINYDRITVALLRLAQHEHEQNRAEFDAIRAHIGMPPRTEETP